jgi:ATP-dependent exoDNAse (exonuclease V) alpha subunit
VAAKLRRILDPSYPSPVRIPLPDQLARLLDRMAAPTRPLHEEQRSAVLRVMGRAIACLQGGAGVGKTYTLKIVCDLYENFGGRVLLGALAGKAALRLARSIGRDAFTLARIIGQLAERERIESALHDPGLDVPAAARLSERLKSLIKIDDGTLVVLDEASMIDLATLHAILRHMPEGARLLLTGDAAQLPPIGFGLVYHALVSDPQVTANLTVIHRQSAESGIPAVSAAIRERRMPVLTEYFFDWAVRHIAVGLLAAARCFAQQHPVGCAVTGSAESFRIDERFQEVNRMAVRLLPIVGDPRRHAAENMRCQMLDAYPRENQKARVVGEESDVASPRFGAPSDVAVA